VLKSKILVKLLLQQHFSQAEWFSCHPANSIEALKEQNWYDELQQQQQQQQQQHSTVLCTPNGGHIKQVC